MSWKNRTDRNRRMCARFGHLTPPAYHKPSKRYLCWRCVMFVNRQYTAKASLENAHVGAPPSTGGGR